MSQTNRDDRFTWHPGDLVVVSEGPTRPTPPLSLDDSSAESLLQAVRALAFNLRWSWDADTADLFGSLVPDLWRATRNPIAVFQAVADDEVLLELHAERILERKRSLDEYLSTPTRLPGAPRAAYFSAEFALDECLPIYSGGLGVLAGDFLKAASDLGLPLVGVGLLYQYGYFHQTLDETGYQREQYDALDPTRLPLQAVLAADGQLLTAPVWLPDRSVFARVWLAQVGRVPLYLLDTNVATNREDDRWITGHLYGGDQDTRIRQEMILGIGGARALRALYPNNPPDVYHMNEGHAAFLGPELARMRLVAGQARSFAEALAQVAPRVAFTTHTPVAAGHDAFPLELMRTYFGAYSEELGLTFEGFMGLGRRSPTDAAEPFSMTVLALRSAMCRNGVSQLHGVVSREMWSGIDVGMDGSVSTPIRAMAAITNGVHTATWAGPAMGSLFERHLGPAWRSHPDESSVWEPLRALEPELVWQARTAQRARLIERVASLAAVEGSITVPPETREATTLVLGFARRFATYKRASLLLHDLDRLHRLLETTGTAASRQILIVFAGKAHPADVPGKLLVQRIVQAARDERFRGRLIFLENYDVEIARLLVQGSDVWLNTPRRPLEASGTSGMKAALNGGLNLSELDGWWNEGYRPEVGWALGQDLPDSMESEARDEAEAAQLLDILEQQVVPLFFDRDARGHPIQWIKRSVDTVCSLAPAFSAHRMVAEYASQIYVPMGASLLDAEPSGS